MLYSALAFLAGISALQWLAELPPWYVWWLGLLLPLCMVPRAVPRGIAWTVAGLLWAWWNAGLLLQQRLPDALEGRDVQVEGRVASMPEQVNDGSTRFRFAIDRQRTGQGWRLLQLPVQLHWYRQPEAMQLGQRWSLRVRLKQPHGFANPGGMDFERWLFADRIRATGYVRPGNPNRRLDNETGIGIAQLRRVLAAYIDNHSTSPALAALLKALTVGVRHEISRQQWEVLRRTGTSHLIAISGLHVGLVATLVFFLTRLAWARLGDAELWPAPSVAAIVAMAAALAYALLAGFEVPAQRATIMVWLWMLARLGGGTPGPWRVWSIALWLVLLLEPLSVLKPGFWLSFGAVAWILYLSVGRYGHLARWRRILCVQTALVIGLTPILWLCFHQASLIAPLANLVAIPWIGLLVVPLLLMAMLWMPLLPALADVLLWIAAGLLSCLWQLLEVLAALPHSLLSLPALPGLVAGLFALGLLCCLALRSVPVRLLGLALLAPALWIKPSRPQTGDVWFTLLDVGQGLAAVVETRQHVLVYDTGPAFPSGFNTGDAVVVPYLSQRGYRHVDRLVVSHGDNDHRGGGGALFAALDVRSIHSGEPETLAWARSTRCREGQVWTWDGVRFEYLGSPGRWRGNNASCVLRVETADGRVVLLPGDIERSVERELLATAPERLAATILVAPHHGSRTSSTAPFVAAVRPRYALFATGYRNRFGFPRAEVADRYRQAGAILRDTASDGAIRVRLDAGKPVAVFSYRAQARRYWH